MMEMICRGGRAVQGFALGTVLGVYSVEDLDKLIKNKDVEMAAMGVEVAKSTDPSIQQDWAALSQAYQAARTVGLKAIADSRSFITPDSLEATYNTNAAFKGVIAALQPIPMQVTRGSKQDIASRLIAAGWKPSYQLPYQVQSDADLTFYKGTDPSNLPNPFDFFKWLEAHKTALIVGGTVVGGVVVLGVLSPYAKLLSAAVSRRPARLP
jgi:hypothetical protein